MVMEMMKIRSRAVTARGGITIPSEMRKRLRLKPGTLVDLREENGRLGLTPIKRLLDEIQGSLRPSPGELSAFEAWFEERKRERMREKR
jgi:AbrB family looped-hinge helix DNA binding protein